MYCLIVNDGFNTIRGIAFQYLSVLFNASDNVFENNWMGLTSDGQSVFVINNNPSADPRANAGEAEASRRNIYRNNTITGSRTNAITLRGQNGLVQSNQIGTRGDGTVPTIDPARWCKANARFNNWFGGAGIVASNDDQYLHPAAPALKALCQGAPGLIISLPRIGLQHQDIALFEKFADSFNHQR